MSSLFSEELSANLKSESSRQIKKDSIIFKLIKLYNKKITPQNNSYFVYVILRHGCQVLNIKFSHTCLEDCSSFK